MEAWRESDFPAVERIYADDAVYYEPYNPPHNGNLLTVSYLKDFLSSKTELEVNVKRIVESEDELTVAVEWSFSYTAAGRRWNKLPRASFVELNEDGRIRYHRDYS